MSNNDLDLIDVDEASTSLIDVERERHTWSPGVSPPPKRHRSESPDEISAGYSSISLSIQEGTNSNGSSVSQENINLAEASDATKANGSSAEVLTSDPQTLSNKKVPTSEEAATQNPELDNSEPMDTKDNTDEQNLPTAAVPESADNEALGSESVESNIPAASETESGLSTSETLSSSDMQMDQSSADASSESTGSANETSS